MKQPSQPVELPDLPCACASVRRAARAVTQLYDSRLRPRGLEAAQFMLLAVLDSRPGASQASLGRAFALDKTTLSRNFRLLVKKGWVESAPAPAKDQRQRGYRLTRSGREQLKAARPGWSEAQELLQSSMTGGQWDAMWKAIRSVTLAASEAQRRPGDAAHG